MKVQNSLVIFLLFATLVCRSQGNTIVGTFQDSSCKEKVLFLYKYNSPFSEELIDKQKSINGVITFRRSDTEMNTYLLRDGKSKGALLFIWDDDITIDLNCENIYESLVFNSPETNELNKIEKQKYNLYIVPIIKLDSLLSQCQKQNQFSKDNSCKTLIIERNTLETENKKLFNEFTKTYIKRNPDSFVSLYYLTYSGSEVSLETKDIELFEFLSERLKKHSRAKIYQQY
ncbi:hypothetical protein [Dyadobacter sp. CY347]|uniref:hypothetical protein n=1 Tax=Dyadobacter sp. CY347 TaxID=2909336 RepID=UPI001F26851C|nr:hypothetical protein [Dyadobacter sp. CY347]MCF2491510.1 hypothetical protein [Dyadobacter sp. CY347]